MALSPGGNRYEWICSWAKVPPARFELATCALGMRCSIQLSYEGTVLHRAVQCPATDIIRRSDLLSRSVLHQQRFTRWSLPTPRTVVGGRAKVWSLTISAEIGHESDTNATLRSVAARCHSMPQMDTITAVGDTNSGGRMELRQSDGVGRNTCLIRSCSKRARRSRARCVR